jgi:tRNA threonylcarbamoyl adenosine modification protein YeaZ
VTILAIDTALGACSVCLLAPGDRVPQALESVAMARGQAEAIAPMLQRVAEAGGGFAAVERIAVTVGPGSYTGLRVGLAAARALGLALGCPVVGISTLSALCAPHVSAGQRSLIAAAIDARNESVYVQAVAADGAVLLQPGLLPVRDAVRRIGAGPVRMTGPGAPRLAVEAWTLGMDVLVIDAPPAPDIAWVARLGGLADPAESPAVPLYLRGVEARLSQPGIVAGR